MPGPRTSGAATGRRPARPAAIVLWARAVLALVVLAVLVIGIPVALVVLGSPSVGELGDVHRLVAALTAPDDGTLFLAVLTVAAWAGWLTFALAVVLEIPAQLRGASVVHVRGLGVQQSVAGGLVTTALAVLLLPGSAVAAEHHTPNSRVAVARPEAAPALRDAGSPATTGPFVVHDSPPVDDEDVYVVQRGDTLWDLAAERLGDGAQWRRIAELNYDRRQPDGRQLDRSHQLLPGWRLVMPAAEKPSGSGEDGDRRTRVVRPGDTLSGIAAEELGTADRWPQIARASAGIVEPGGQRLTDPDTILPGWTVRIPQRSSSSSSSSSSSRASRPSLPTRGRHAHPGTTSSGEDPSPSARLDPSWTTDVRTPAPTIPAGPTVPDDAGTDHASVAEGPSALPRTQPGDDGVEDGAGDGLLADAGDVRTLGGVGALLAACLVLLVGARRSRQQHRRRPGERLPVPPPSVLATEARLRSVADPAGVAHIDLALRALAAEHRALGRPLPGLRFARLTRTHLELCLTASMELPRPWTPTSDPTVWAMTHQELTGQVETDMRSPYPALVTIGHDLENAHVLVDLEQAGALAIDGERSDALPVLAGAAVELATSPWADDLLVTLVGCLPHLPERVTTGRLRHVDRLERLITDLEGRAGDVERVLRDAGVQDLATARGTGVADDTWSPEIVLVADEVSAPLRERLEAVLHRVPRVGVAAMTAGTSLGEWHLRLDAAVGLARLDPLGLTLRPQRLAGDDYRDVLELLDNADAAPVAGPGWASGLPSLEQALADLPAPAPDDVDRRDEGREGDLWTITAAPSQSVGGFDVTGGTDPTGTGAAAEPAAATAAAAGAGVAAATDPAGDAPADASASADIAGSESVEVVHLPARAPQIRLLGPVEVLGALGPEPVAVKDGRAVANHVGRATALVAYLACRPEGATTEQVSEALSPVRRLTPSTVWSLASRTRKWLGSDPDGAPYFPRTSDAGALRLHPAVRTDWSHWLELVGPDVMETPLARLLDALALVRGRPFDGVTERHYVWAEPIRQDMISGVVDVAHEVVRRVLLVPDGPAARRGVAIGRLVDPTNEVIWRDALRVEYVVGSHESRRRLIDQLYSFADDLETDLEPETEQLIADLERSRGERVAAR